MGTGGFSLLTHSPSQIASTLHFGGNSSAWGGRTACCLEGDFIPPPSALSPVEEGFGTSATLPSRRVQSQALHMAAQLSPPASHWGRMGKKENRERLEHRRRRKEGWEKNFAFPPSSSHTAHTHTTENGRRLFSAFLLLRKGASGGGWGREVTSLLPTAHGHCGLPVDNDIRRHLSLPSLYLLCRMGFLLCLSLSHCLA